MRKYKHCEKGGVYEVVGASTGAGSLKGWPLMVYRCLITGRLYHCEPERFARRMVEITEAEAIFLAATGSH